MDNNRRNSLNPRISLISTNGRAEWLVRIECLEGGEGCVRKGGHSKPSKLSLQCHAKLSKLIETMSIRSIHQIRVSISLLMQSAYDLQQSAVSLYYKSSIGHWTKKVI